MSNGPASEGRTTRPRLILLAVFIAASLAVAYTTGYRLPVTLTMSVKAHKPDTYILYCYTEATGGPPVTRMVSTASADGFQAVGFDLPDARIVSLGVGLGNAPGVITVGGARLEGPLGGVDLSPEDIMRYFVPADAAAAECRLTVEGLVFPVSGEGATLRSVDPELPDLLARTSGTRILLPGAAILVSLLLFFATRDTYRFGARLLFLLVLVAYAGYAGVYNVSVLFWAGLFALCFAELRLGGGKPLLAMAGLAMAMTMSELVCLAYARYVDPPPVITTESRSIGPFWMRMDPGLAYRGTGPTVHVESRRVGDDYICRDVRYTLGTDGFRVTPPEPGAARHALFFGGSFTFGDGVGDGETMPAHFGRAAGHEYQAYNFGFSGWGPGQAYRLLEDPDSLAGVGQREGIAVYNFIGDHVYRDTPRFADFYHDFPVFRLGPDGGLDGPFKLYDRPGLKLWYDMFGSPDGHLYRMSPALRYIFTYVSAGPVPMSERLEVTEKVLARCRDMYASRFGGDFYVVIWERDSLSDREIARFAEELRNDGVRVVFVPPMPDPLDEFLSPYEKHPSARKYRWAAEHLLHETREPSGIREVEPSR